jgi:hypothetical protein
VLALALAAILIGTMNLRVFFVMVRSATEGATQAMIVVLQFFLEFNSKASLRRRVSLEFL